MSIQFVSGQLDRELPGDFDLLDEWRQLDRQCLHIEDVFWRKILL